MDAPIATFEGMPAHIGLGMNRRATIRVFAGALEFDFKGQKFLKEAAVVYRQEGGKVRVNHALFPPWLNTVIFLHERSGLPIYASLPPWRRRELERAVVTAGFELVVKRRVLMGAAE